MEGENREWLGAPQWRLVYHVGTLLDSPASAPGMSSVHPLHSQRCWQHPLRAGDLGCRQGEASPTNFGSAALRAAQQGPL